MSLKKCQKEVDKWVSQYKLGYWEPFELLARLTEETGEVAREMNHMYGPKKKKEYEKDNSLAEEMGDIIFTLCCLANKENIDLDESFAKAMAKCYGRDKDRFEKK